MRKKRYSAFPAEGLRFLRELKRNNNREWFQERKGIYEEAVRLPMHEILEQITPPVLAAKQVRERRLSVLYDPA